MIYVAIAFFFATLGCLLGFLIGFSLGDKNDDRWNLKANNNGGWPTHNGNQTINRWPLSPSSKDYKVPGSNAGR